jgi:predicted DCC family thiol-disulfide oxidoreductase YuxK
MLIIYDETRSDNRRFVRFLMRNDRNNVFCFATTQSHIAQILVKRNNLPADKTPILVSGDHIYTRADELIRASMYLDGPWRALCLLRLLPSVLRNKTVNLILNNQETL